MQGHIPSITGIILVGGKSNRMGMDKALLQVDGVPMLERVLRVMAENFASLLLVGDREDLSSRYALPVIADSYPGSALGGLYTGLLSANTDLVFVAPCDLPFASSTLIRHLCSFAQGFDAVVPLTENGFEPLFALYRKSCLEPMKRLLDQGNYRVYDFYREVNVHLVNIGELNGALDGKRSLLNINTPDEYAAVKNDSEFALEKN